MEEHHRHLLKRRPVAPVANEPDLVLLAKLTKVVVTQERASLVVQWLAQVAEKVTRKEGGNDDRYREDST
jgi:hypothetical protein